MPQKLSDLHQASYRGAIWIVDGAKRSGAGRKQSIKELASTDRVVIEDLGKRVPTIILRGVVTSLSKDEINPETGQPDELSYFDMRNELLQALESDKGPGELVHPWYGPMQNMVVLDYDFDESVGKLNESPITITFRQTEVKGVPIPESTSIGQINEADAFTRDVMGETIEDSWIVKLKNSGNFLAAKEKISGVTDAVGSAMDGIDAATAELSAAQNALGEFSRKATELVTKPTELATSMRNTFASLQSLKMLGTGVFAVYQSMFNFGDDEADIDEARLTEGLLERERNRKLMNNAVQATCYASANEASATIPFRTVGEIETHQQLLEDQYNKLVGDDSLDDSLREAINESRLVTNQFFEAQKLVANQVIEVDVTPTSLRQIAYRYYGDTELGEVLGDLNELTDARLVGGDNFKVLTE